MEWILRLLAGELTKQQAQEQARQTMEMIRNWFNTVIQNQSLALEELQNDHILILASMAVLLVLLVAHNLEMQRQNNKKLNAILRELAGLQGKTVFDSSDLDDDGEE